MHNNLGIGSWIARRAITTPERIAVVHHQQRLSYRELDLRVTRLARGLAARGIDRGDRVAFVGHNHVAALETLFACGLLGAVAVPVHPGFDDDALAQVLTDSAPAAIIVGAELESRIASLPAAQRVEHRFTTGTGILERYDELLASGSDEPIDRPVGLDDLCLLAFSSGTTGRNKGVRLTHGNLLFNALNTLTSLDYRRDDVLLTSAPLHRMGGLGFTLTMLLVGGTCVIQDRPDAAESLRLVEQEQVTTLFDAVDALGRLEQIAASQPERLRSLRVCATGGTRVPAELVDRFSRHGVVLQPGYGLTEAAPVCLVLDRDEVERHPGATGRPPMFTAVRVVDGELEDVAPGELGELLVRGPNVMPGYWQNPSADARAFADGWLRTGDAACIDERGMITVLGRIADALVLDGRLVHPATIEDALRVERGVDCAVVQAAPEDTPVLFAALDPSRPVEASVLLASCRAALGVQPTLRPLDALPTNANAKVLRAELRQRIEVL